MIGVGKSKSELLGLGDHEFVPWNIGIVSESSGHLQSLIHGVLMTSAADRR